MSKVRVFKVKKSDRVAGHGMTLPCYELEYEGWELDNPPTEVIEKRHADQIAEAIVNHAGYIEHIIKHREEVGKDYSRNSSILPPIKKLLEALKNYQEGE